jgi:3-oxoacyl-[acyl-carrier protein] reductase
VAPTPRTALITGGARGIGSALAVDLARDQWRIAICYRTSEGEAKATCRAVKEAGGEALAERADVSDPAQVEALFAAVEAALGPVEVLVNAAGPYHRAAVLDETPEGWRAMFAGNLDSVFYVCRRAAPSMIERGWGRMLSFSLASADRIAANLAVTAHAIAKTGVLSLTRALARALAPHGVTANCISPGFIDSKSAPAEELERMKKRIPAGYVGATDDVVAAARYLLSDRARYVTGSNVHVSGGWGL